MQKVNRTWSDILVEFPEVSIASPSNYFSFKARVILTVIQVKYRLSLHGSKLSKHKYCRAFSGRQDTMMLIQEVLH